MVIFAFPAALLIVLVLVVDHLVPGFRPSPRGDEGLSVGARILCLAIAGIAVLLSLAAMLSDPLGIIAFFTVVPVALGLIGLVAVFDRGRDSRESSGKPPRSGA
jgi:hypothetical protein